MQKILPFKMQKSVPVLVLENLKKLPAKKPKQSLNGDAKQKVGGQTGFNSLKRNEIEVCQDSVVSLPTIDAPATNMSTKDEVLARRR